MPGIRAARHLDNGHLHIEPRCNGVLLYLNIHRSFTSPAGAREYSYSAAGPTQHGWHPCRGLGELNLHSPKDSCQRAGGEDAMDSEEPGDEVKEKQEQAVHLIAELKQSMKCVLGDADKLKGEPLGDGVYTLTLFCALVEQSLGHGLKGSSRPRWPFWSAGKTQFSFFNVLELSEQSMSEKQAFRESFGLDAVRGLTWVRSSLGQLRAWLRLSLNAGLLGARLRFVLEDSDLLEQWYENWALLRTEDASEELVSLIMSLDAINTCLSVSEGLALDHQKFVISDGPSGQVMHSDNANPDTNEPLLGQTNFAAAHGLSRQPLFDMQGSPGEVDVTLEQKIRANRKGSSKKRFISVLDEDEHAQTILGRLDQGRQNTYASLYHESVFRTAVEGWKSEDLEPSSTSQQVGLQQAGIWQDRGREKAVEDERIGQEEGGSLQFVDRVCVVSSAEDSDFFQECLNSSDEQTAAGWNNGEEVVSYGDGHMTSQGRADDAESFPGTPTALSSLSEGFAIVGDTTRDVSLAPEDDVFTSKRDSSVGALSFENFDGRLCISSVEAELGEAGLALEVKYQNGEADQTDKFIGDLVSAKPQRGSSFFGLERIEQPGKENEVDGSGKEVMEHIAVLNSPSASGEEGRDLMSDCESDISILGESTEGDGATKLIVKHTWTAPSHSKRMNKMFSLCRKLEDELAYGAGDWDDFEQNNGEATTFGDASTDIRVTGVVEDLNISALQSQLCATRIVDNPLYQETVCDNENLDDDENDEPKRQTSIEVIGFGEARATEGIPRGNNVAEDEFCLQDRSHQDSAASDAVCVPQVMNVETHRIVSDRLEQDRNPAIWVEENNPAQFLESLLHSRTSLLEISGPDGEGSQVDAGPQLADGAGLASQEFSSFNGCEADMPGHAMDTSLPEEASSASSVKGQQRNVFSASDVFVHSDEEIEALKQGTRRKGCIVRLGSKEAEELLQLDVTKLGRASFQSMQGDTTTQNRQFAFDWGAEDLGPDELSRYVEKLEVKETYMDTVLDMESVLLEADDSNSSRIFQHANGAVAGSFNVRSDGGQYASTSGFLSFCKIQPAMSKGKEVIWVEVIGARQRRGGASLGERVVGVQEHTLYRILVKGIDSEWEIERRYRDFVLLHSKLFRLFRSQSGFFLPSPWDKVKGESRKIFGNTSPNVVEVRSALIQVCLQSLILAGAPLKTAGPLLDFLSPGAGIGWTSAVPLVNSPLLDQKAASQLPLEDFISTHSESPRSDTVSSVVEQDQDAKASAVFGKTIRLIVQVHGHKPVKQQLHAQHHACAGCYKHLASATGLVPSFVQTLGLAGPRLCEYTGQLFCSACHSNELAVIPAHVLQNWDFSLRKVSQLAKGYLDSIYDQPMLCVSAVNPYLYARVPILANVRDMRRKLSRLAACLNCPARSRILAMVGSRRYLVENNDFFALRDLADLSKGAFSVLPGFMKTFWERVYVHITRECPVCHETGEACGAGEWCDEPFDTIFPFQDDGITRCPACQLPFHRLCFTTCSECPSCHGRPPPARLAEDTLSSSGYSTGESAKELTTRTKVSLFSTSDGGHRPRSNKKRSSKGPSNPGVKGNRSNSLVLNMSALSAPLEL